MAAAPLLLRTIPLLRLRLYQYSHATGLIRRPLCTAVDSTRPDNDLFPAEKTIPAVSSLPSRHPQWNEDPDFRKWKDKEAEIMREIERVWALAKEILHSDLYVDGERLSVEDEKIVVENLLAYHPHSDDKIGCGLDYIMDDCQSSRIGFGSSFSIATERLSISNTVSMVDRHPQFRNSRCLFVVRTDGGWIDFSYQKCLRAYIRSKYPMHAERFIREHFKRGSG